MRADWRRAALLLVLAAAGAALMAPTLVASSPPASAAEGVTIEYIAHATFRITSPGGHSLLVDPFASRTWIGYDYPGRISTDAVLISHPHYDHDAGIYRGSEPPWDESMLVLREPGTYEVGDIRITGVEGKHADPYGEEFGQINTIWLIEVGGLRVVHTGDNGPINDRIQGELGSVDLLMLPVDAEFHILSQATIDDYRARLQPRLLVPMHYRHDDLETEPDEPGDLGNIDDWAIDQARVQRVGSDHVTMGPDDLPPEAGILIFEHSPAIAPPQGAADFEITNVTVIDSLRGARPGMNVSIADGRIVSVRDAPGRSPGRVVDGTGKYLIPGLWDAHVHFAYEPELAPAMFNLFLANGITSVRDTGGQLDEVMPWKRFAESGEVPAPRVFVAGPLLDGVPRVYDGSVPSRPNLGVGIDSAAAARDAVDHLAAEGVDLIKAYELLAPEVFAAVVERAAEHGLPVTGHPPLSMHAAEAAQGLDSIEHLRNLELACSAEADQLLEERRLLLAAGAADGGTLRSSIHAAQRGRAVATFSAQRCDELVAALRAADSWQVPTLTIVMPRVKQLYARESWRANFQYLPEPARSRWTEGAEAMDSSPPDAATAAHGAWASDMVRRLADADVPIMAGTDTPIFFLTPGFSLHEELANLVDAGLTPAQALAAATITPARYFHLESELGAIAPGMRADLVLLAANPLADIRNTQTIEAVVQAGQLFDRDAIRELLAAAAQAGPH